MAEASQKWVLSGSDSCNQDFPQAVGTLLEMRLGSLTIRCPQCRRKGLAMTKWVAGRKTKPLFVFHGNGDHTISECQVPGEFADSLRGSLSLSIGDLRRLLRTMRAYVLFSGGADSLCTLLHLLEAADGQKARITVVHVDTTAGFPEVTRYVRRVCRKLRVALEVVRAKRDYFELAKRWGIPSFNARWCCNELKVKPVRDFLRSEPEPKMVVDGIRAAESNQRSTYLPVWYHPEFRCLSVSPLLDWSDEDVASRVEASGLPENPGKSLGCSAECWCGAYKTRRDFEQLLDVHPEIFEKLVEVEKAQNGRFTFIYEDGRQIRLQDIRKTRRDS